LRKISANRRYHFVAKIFRLGLKDMGWKSAQRAMCPRGGGSVKSSCNGSWIERESGKFRVWVVFAVKKAPE
jgi:hypothetical protein